ncbi:hypothetical protein FRC17_000274 [Serendipita sp. 399]|nr:hypothetical protein FRC17_000274 [Serendipita sp. 399]
MLSLHAAVPKTPHAKLKNENQLGGSRAFPKTPLPKQLLVTTTEGKPSTPVAASRLRKGLVDKTPGAHLKNRPTQPGIQLKDGEKTILLIEKAPSASRKSVKQPRFSEALRPTDVKQSDEEEITNKVAEIKLFDVTDDDDDLEPEYMPPSASAQPLGDEYALNFSGGETAKFIMEIARIPLDQWFEPPPLSYDEEAFFLPEELLRVPLSPLASDSDSDVINTKPQEPTSTSHARRGAQKHAVPTRTSSRLAQKAAAKPVVQKARQKQAKKQSQDLMEELIPYSSDSAPGRSKISSITGHVEEPDPTSEVELLPELQDYFLKHETEVEGFLFDV